MPVAASGVKPSQFYTSQHGDVSDVQDHQGEDTRVDEDRDHGQVPEDTVRGDTAGDDAGILDDDHKNCQDRGEIEGVERVVADVAVEQQPITRSKRNRKPNSKYDPAVFDLDSVEIRGIPLSGKKNGWKGVYWPK